MGHTILRKICHTLSSLQLLFWSASNTLHFPKYKFVLQKALVIWKHPVNSPHPLLLQTGRQSALSPAILNILHAGTIQNCQVRAFGRGRGQWTETQGTYSLYVAPWLWPAAAVCTKCRRNRLPILTVVEEFVQFLESTQFPTQWGGSYKQHHTTNNRKILNVWILLEQDWDYLNFA